MRRHHVEVAPGLVDGLADYYDLLLRWNAKINLTGLKDGDEAIDRLLVEPVIASRGWPEPTGLLIDVGSGGGSPALPLKLAVPSVRLVMIEAKVRKSAFLREAVRQLDCGDARVEHGRLESIATRPEFAERADVVTMRAVRAGDAVLANAAALLRPGGWFFLFGRVGAGNAQPWPPPWQLLAEDTLVPELQTAVLRLRKVT